MAIERREFKKREYTPSATGRLFHLSGKKIKGIRGPVGCLAGECRIWTERGLERMDELYRRGEPFRVYSMHKSGRVCLEWATAPFVKGREPLLRVDLEGGGSFMGAAAHLVYLAADTWRKIEDLQPGDVLKQWPGMSRKVNRVVKTNADVYYDLTVEATGNYIGEWGIVHHNSGKSVSCCLEVFLRSCGQEANSEGKRESKWLFYRRHAVDLELTTLQTWLEWFPETLMKYDSPMTGEYRCAHPSGDGTEVVIHLVMMGLETDEDIKKLKSLELSGAWGNEATQIPWKVHSTVYERLGRYPRACGGKKYPRLGLLMDTNSPHESNWWKRRSEDIRDENEEYFTQPPALLREWIERGDGVKGWKYTPNIGQRDGVLPAENVENHNEGFAYWLNMVRTKDEDDIRTQVLNEYGLSVAGLPIYPEWKDGWHYRPGEVRFEKGRLLVAGLDFGRTPAAVLLQMGRDGQVRCLEEVVSEDMGIRQFCEELLIPVLVERYGWGCGTRLVCFADPAGANPNEVDSVSAIEMVNACGIECWPCDVAGNSFVLRSNCVKELLRGVRDGRPAVVVGERCKVLRNGFNGGYCYKKMAGGVLGEERYAPGPDKSSFYTHIQDAFQYGVWSLLRGNRYSGGLVDGVSGGNLLLGSRLPESRFSVAM